MCETVSDPSSFRRPEQRNVGPHTHPTGIRAYPTCRTVTVLGAEIFCRWYRGRTLETTHWVGGSIRIHSRTLLIYLITHISWILSWTGYCQWTGLTFTLFVITFSVTTSIATTIVITVTTTLLPLLPLLWSERRKNHFIVIVWGQWIPVLRWTTREIL